MMSWGAGRWVAVPILAASLAACATAPASYSVHRAPGAPAPYAGASPLLEHPMSPLQCVPFARDASGIQIFGDAHTWWVQAEGRYPRSSIPAAGSVLVLRGYADANRGHVAVVTSVISSREILIDQANWMNEGEITRGVPVLDVSAANDWSEVRVWWLPTQSWGARIYQGQGFIHPLPLMTLAGSQSYY
jgi:surface antigen